MQGTIKKLVSDKGFGFIVNDEARTDEYFFHHSAVENSVFNELEEGQAVVFEGADGPKGKRAEKVRPT